MVRRGLYEKTGKFSLEYPFSGDLDHWLKISYEYDIAYLSNVWMTALEGEHSDTYRLTIATPLGYLDTLKIYTKLIYNSGVDVPQYTLEINAALYKYIRECLYGSIVYTGNYSFKPTMLIGSAISAWSMIDATTCKIHLTKLKYLMMIACIFFMTSTSILKKICKIYALRGKKR